MLETLKAWDECFFAYLNGFHHPYADTLMAVVTHRNTWIPLYLFFIYLIIRQFNRQSFFLLLAIALLITLSDRITSGFMKPFFERLRPCHEPALQQIIHLVGNCGGQYGFASSHAANTVALAVFLILLWSKNNKWAWFILLWAILVAYSRVYTGVHYPGDVLAGGLIGGVLAIAIFNGLKIFLIKTQSPRLS